MKMALFTETPFVRLSPLPVNEDYRFGLLESEGAMDVFDLIPSVSL